MLLFDLRLGDRLAARVHHRHLIHQLIDVVHCACHEVAATGVARTGAAERVVGRQIDRGQVHRGEVHGGLVGGERATRRTIDLAELIVMIDLRIHSIRLAGDRPIHLAMCAHRRPLVVGLLRQVR